jgi:hypothetical protein
MSNVHKLDGSGPLAVPNRAMIDGLEQLLEMAKSGQLQSFIGTGFTFECLRVSHWSDFHDDIYQMLGSLEWLKAEYIDRNESRRS